MAISPVADRGSTTNLVSQTATPVDMAAAGSIAVGSYLFARIAANNSGLNGAACTLTVSDPRGNTWTVAGPALQDPGAADSGIATYIAYTKVVNAYTNGDDITFNWNPTCTGRAIVIEEWSGIHSVTPIGVAAVTANATSAATSISRTPTAAGQVFYGAFGTEGRTSDVYTQDTDTTDGTWVSLTTLATGNTGTTDVKIHGAYKIVTGTSPQTWNTTITSRDWAAIALVLNPTNIQWYVDNAATGANDGTSWANAWNSFASINWSKIGPGDTINISGGTTTKTYNELLAPNASNTNQHGTSTNRITIRRGVDAGHTGTPIIDGGNTRANCLDIGGYVSWLWNYITISGLKFQNASENPVWVRDCTDVIIDNCEAVATDNPVYSQAIFANRNIGFTVRNCTITSVALTVGQADGIYLSENTGTTLIENNTITISNTDSTGHSDGIQCYLNGATIIRNNVITGPTAGTDNHTMWLSEFTTGTTSYVYNNVLISRADQVNLGLFRSGDATGHGQVNIYNNTIYGGGYAVYFGRYTNVQLKNNIIQPRNTAADYAYFSENGTLATANVTNNLVYLTGSAKAARVSGTDRTYSQWTTTDGYNANGKSADPKFTNPGTNFTLQSSSPAINAGTTLAAVTTDIIGTARPQFTAYDIGAYESLVPPASADTTMFFPFIAA